MDTIITTIIVSVIASSGFWAFLNTVLIARRDRKSLERKALLALLHDKLYCSCSEYIQRGELSADDYENLTYLYDPYIAMGGNGTCERLKREVDKLPIRR